MKSVLLHLIPLSLLLLTAAPVVQAQDYDSLVQEAMTLRNRGDLQGAEVRLREAWPLAANTSEVAYLLAMVLAFQERFQEGQTLINEALQLYPDNLDLQLAHARILAFQGRHGEAAAAVATLRRNQPDNLDASNLAARIALYQSQPRRALDLFDLVLTAAPDNLEALVGRHDALRMLGDTAAAETALQNAEAIAPQHMDVVARRSPESITLSRPHEVSLGFSRSDFSQPGFSQWNDRFLEYRHLHANGNQEFLRASHNHRFDLHDTQVEAGLLRRQDAAWPLELSIGVTEKADFLADWFVRAGTRRLLNPGTQALGAAVLTPMYQYASFSNGDTHRVQLGLEYYLPGTDVWFTPAVGMVRDQDGIETFAWSLGAHWQLSTRHRLGLSYSDAPETENLLTTDTRTYALYWRHALTDAWTLIFAANRLDRAASYQRDEYSLVLQHRF
jgi:YaiO family outer membrane protein